jgi:hypothetical protein
MTADPAARTGGQPGTRRPRETDVALAEASLGVVAETPEDGRMTEAIRAAAAATQGELTGAAYEDLRRSKGEPWPSAGAIAARFGTFAQALSEAGVHQPDRLS